MTLNGRLVAVFQIALAFTLILSCAYASLATLDRGFNFDNQIQLAAQRYGPRGKQVLEAWRDMILAEQKAPILDRINEVNDFVNRRVAYAEDRDSWGTNDYWATPLETLGRGVGDCEDFAIAKYFSLLILGVPTDNLRITYVRARIGGPRSTVFIAHMVLAYYPKVNAEPLILDNLIGEVEPASQRPDLAPIFSFNSDGLWIGSTTNSSGSSTARLSRWRDLIARMHADGFE